MGKSNKIFAARVHLSRHVRGEILNWLNYVTLCTKQKERKLRERATEWEWVVEKNETRYTTKQRRNRYTRNKWSVFGRKKERKIENERKSERNKKKITKYKANKNEKKRTNRNTTCNSSLLCSCSFGCPSLPREEYWQAFGKYYNCFCQFIIFWRMDKDNLRKR